MRMSFMSHSEAETEKIAARLAKTLRGGETLLLSGELGAGKTVFVRGLARALGVRGRITSPTFVLLRAHRTGRTKGLSDKKTKQQRNGCCSVAQSFSFLVHVDAYRVRDARELEAIGLDEWIGRSDTVVAIEWGERVRRLASTHSVRVRIEGSGEQRRVSITKR